MLHYAGEYIRTFRFLTIGNSCFGVDGPIFDEVYYTLSHLRFQLTRYIMTG